MFCFERLFDVGRHAVFTDDPGIPTVGSLESCVLALRAVFLVTRGLLPFPNWCEVRFTLDALEGFWRRRKRWLLRYEIYDVFQTNEIYEFRI